MQETPEIPHERVTKIKNAALRYAKKRHYVDPLPDALSDLTSEGDINYFLKFERLMYDLQVLLSKEKILKKLNSKNRNNARELVDRLFIFFNNVYHNPNSDIFFDLITLARANENNRTKKEVEKIAAKYSHRLNIDPL